MPTYEYKCTKCGHRFEIFQSMKDEPLTTCPVCKGKIKRLIGAGAGPSCQKASRCCNAGDAGKSAPPTGRARH